MYKTRVFGPWTTWGGAEIPSLVFTQLAADEILVSHRLFCPLDWQRNKERDFVIAYFITVVLEISSVTHRVMEGTFVCQCSFWATTGERVGMRAVWCEKSGSQISVHTGIITPGS